MSERLDASLLVGSDPIAFDSTHADVPEAHPAYSAYPKVGIVTGEPDRLDARSVEHTRQSRLQRWQRLP